MTTNPTAPPSVFGAVHLGYIVIETNRPADWRRFGTDADSAAQFAAEVRPGRR